MLVEVISSNRETNIILILLAYVRVNHIGKSISLLMSGYFNGIYHQHGGGIGSWVSNKIWTGIVVGSVIGLVIGSIVGSVLVALVQEVLILLLGQLSLEYSGVK
jgi:hypothetical protein